MPALRIARERFGNKTTNPAQHILPVGVNTLHLKGVDSHHRHHIDHPLTQLIMLSISSTC